MSTALRGVYTRVLSVGPLARALEQPLPALARRAVRESRLVEDRPRYVAATVLGARGLHRYRLRERDRTVWLGPGDGWVFNEIFAGRVYDLPDEVAAVMGPEPLVLDLGANVGFFGLYVLDAIPGSRVVGYEPDPGNLHRCRKNLASAIAAGRYELVEAAAGTASGQATFTASLGGRSHLGADDEGHGITVPVEDVLPRLAGADLAKIDIEGGEWSVLADPRLADAGPRAVALEFHAMGCPGSDPHATAVELLARAGYRTVSPRRPFGDDEFPEGQGMLWAVRSP